MRQFVGRLSDSGKRRRLWDAERAQVAAENERDGGLEARTTTREEHEDVNEWNMWEEFDEEEADLQAEAEMWEEADETYMEAVGGGETRGGIEAWAEWARPRGEG